jgi:hypothetical protein
VHPTRECLPIIGDSRVIARHAILERSEYGAGEPFVSAFDASDERQLEASTIISIVLRENHSSLIAASLLFRDFKRARQQRASFLLPLVENLGLFDVASVGIERAVGGHFRHLFAIAQSFAKLDRSFSGRLSSEADARVEKANKQKKLAH